MDYVDWVDRVFAAVDDARKAADDGSRREPFLRFPYICGFLGLEGSSPDFEETETAKAAELGPMELRGRYFARPESPEHVAVSCPPFQAASRS